MASKSYNDRIVAAFFWGFEIPAPIFELRFEPTRRWRFDLAWPEQKVAIEVQGGIWTRGRHTQGAALLKEWEKLNHAAIKGWHILYCQPADLMKVEFAKTVKAALKV